MRIIDLAQSVYDACPNCPVHPGVGVELLATHENGGGGEDSWHMEKMTLASHTGSHLDAPLHRICGGKAIDDFPLSDFCGAAWIADLRGVGARTPIDGKMLEGKLKGKVEGGIVLLATGWGEKRVSGQEWHYDSPFLNEDGARWLTDRNVKMVGIDHYSIGGSQEPGNGNTHTILLSKPVLIVEDLNFPAEAFGLAQPVEFMALPIHFRAFSGSFCRPVIIVR